MAVSSFMVPLGTPAPPFALPALDGRLVESDALATGRPVLAIEAVAICSNDTENYPDDATAGLVDQAHRAGFGFPYLVDDTQQVALAYRAACTPDFFIYDAQRRLAYRGEFDESRPRNDVPVTGAALRAALDLVLAGQPVPEPQVPSVGCGIKWKAGNEPS
jgi:peroxiredoxin